MLASEASCFPKETMNNSSRSIVLACVLAAAGAVAQAADAFTDAMVSAYAPYRAALFKTNSKSQPESLTAIAQTQSAWKALIVQFGGKPPAPYDRDARFDQTLNQIDAVYAKAARQIQANQLADAHETLEAARDLLADLRARNGVVVFSDHMNAYHAEMEHLLLGADKLLADSQDLPLLMARVGVLEYLSQELRNRAPADLARADGFAPLLADVQASVQSLKKAVLSQDLAAVRAAIGKVKAPYSKLFVKFG